MSNLLRHSFKLTKGYEDVVPFASPASANPYLQVKESAPLLAGGHKQRGRPGTAALPRAGKPHGEPIE